MLHNKQAKLIPKFKSKCFSVNFKIRHLKKFKNNKLWLTNLKTKVSFLEILTLKCTAFKFDIQASILFF